MACGLRSKFSWRKSCNGAGRIYARRCPVLVRPGRGSPTISRRKPRISRRVFPGCDCDGLSDLPACAPQCFHGSGQGSPAGGRFSLLGGESVLAKTSAGWAVQRHRHRTFRAGCVLRNCQMAGGSEPQCFHRIRCGRGVPMHLWLPIRQVQLMSGSLAAARDEFHGV